MTDPEPDEKPTRRQGSHSLAFYAIYEPDCMTLEEYRRMRAEVEPKDAA